MKVGAEVVMPPNFRLIRTTRGRGVYVYFRKTRPGIAVDLDRFPLGTRKFHEECARIQREYDAGRASSAASAHGTLGAVIAAYKNSDRWRKLADRTKADYRKVLSFLEETAEVRFTRFTTPVVCALLDSMVREGRGVTFTNRVRIVLSLLAKVATAKGWAPADARLQILAVTPIPADPERARPNVPWQAAEFAAVIDACPQELVPPLMLMHAAGLDPQDCIRISWEDVRVRAFDFGNLAGLDIARLKSGGASWVPIQPELAAVLRGTTPGSGPIARRSDGSLWTVETLRRAFGKVRAPLVAQKRIRPGLTMKGLRHSFATDLADAGAEKSQIADALGHATCTVTERYIKDSDRAAATTQALLKLQLARQKGTRRPGAPCPGPHNLAQLLAEAADTSSPYWTSALATA